MTLRKLLEQKNLYLPGENLAKTIVYIIFPICVMLLITDNPLFIANIKELIPHQHFSFLLLLASISTAVLSGWFTHYIMSEEVEHIKRYFSLFYGKILLGVSVLLFYIVVCWWVLLVGGITLSPFSTLLSMSPILLLIQMFRDKNSFYDSFHDTIKEDWESSHNNQVIRGHTTVKWTLIILNSFPLIIVVATLIIGQWAVCKLGIHEIILGKKIDLITNTEWYVMVYHVIYYLSVLIAIVGVMPPTLLQKISRTIF